MVNASSPVCGETKPGRENDSCFAVHSVEDFKVVVVVDVAAVFAAEAPNVGPRSVTTTTNATVIDVCRSRRAMGVTVRM
jgi:hypothetical protein